MKVTGFLLLLVGLASFAHAGLAVAPEIDAGVAGGAFALIGGAALIIRSRRRKA